MDTITTASLALIISLFSIWLSYRTARLAKMVAAAEKRTQAHSILIGILLEAEELLSIVRRGRTYEGVPISGPDDLGEMTSDLVTIVESIAPRLAWLRGSGCTDSALLEEYKLYALDAEARIKKLAPRVRGMSLRAPGTIT